MQNQQNNNDNIITLDQLQKEVGEWSRRNFPNNKPHHPLLGIIEEIGELRSAKKDNIGDAEDAIGDTFIYAADYCERNELSLSEVFSLTDVDHPFENGAADTYIISVGRLCHFQLKGEQGIRHSKETIESNKLTFLASILSVLLCVAQANNIDWQQSIHNTWNKVKQRDWQTNPMNAAMIAEGNHTRDIDNQID